MKLAKQIAEEHYPLLKSDPDKLSRAFDSRRDELESNIAENLIPIRDLLIVSTLHSNPESAYECVNRAIKMFEEE